MLVFATRAVAAGEEVCVTYVDIEKTSHEACAARFASWASTGDGFVCACAACAMLRARPALRAMNAEVHAAHARAGGEMATGSAADAALPPARRAAIVAAHADLPLAQRHGTVVRCLLLEAAARADRGDIAGGTVSAGRRRQGQG